MDNLARSLNQNLLFDLPEIYKQDVWDLSQNPVFPADVREKANTPGKSLLVFDSPANEFLKNEVKGFMYHLIHEKKLSLSHIISYKHFIKLYFSFMYETNPSATSILDVPLDEGESNYRRFIESHGRKTHSPIGYIDKNLNSKTHSVKNTIFGAYHLLYKFIEGTTSNVREFDKDTWDVRNLDIKVEIAAFQPYYTIPFGDITQPWLKYAVKRFSYYRLQHKALSTVRTDLKGIKNFSKFLSDNRPDVVGLDQLDRQVMEEFIAWTSLKGYEAKPFNQQLTGVRNMLMILPFLGFEDAPSKKLILDSDYRRHIAKLPEFFSDSELKRLNAHLCELPPQIARMVFVLENVGMRISDICCMEDDCLKKSADDKYILKYYQQKTHQYNTVPINEIVGHTIEEAIRESKSQFGDSCRYVFASGPDRPILGNTFRKYLKQIAQKNDLKFDDGTPFNVKTHTFRGTVATQYANLGIDLDFIRLMLGHADVSVLKHYITIHSTTMIECMRPITEEDNDLIANIGHVDEIKPAASEPALLALPNGSCTNTASAEPCSHANACYTCRMFRPSRCHLDLYKKQLSDTEANLAIAEINGYERLLVMNKELKENLIRIITSLEKGD